MLVVAGPFVDRCHLGLTGTTRSAKFSRSQRRSSLRVGFDQIPFGGCGQAIGLLKCAGMLQQFIATAANPHDVLIVLSSCDVSGLLDSPQSAANAVVTKGENDMSEKSATTYTVLHLRFKLRVPPDVFLANSREAAATFGSLQALIWKIWVFDQEEFQIGGICLFANRENADAYLNHPLIQVLRRDPAVAYTRCQLWGVESSLSALTRGPLPDIYVQYLEPAAALAGGE
jgi:hypothetical protein